MPGKLTFSDLHTEALALLNEIRHLVRFSEEYLWASLPPKYDNRALELSCVLMRVDQFHQNHWAAGDAAKRELERAIPRPTVVSLCGEHSPYAHLVVGLLGGRILDAEQGIRNMDDGLAAWRATISGPEAKLVLPRVDDLDRLGAALEAERIQVEKAGGEDTEDFVTLRQAAAIVNRSKRTLEKHKVTMPVPRISDGGGKPDEWAWSELRPWLEEWSGRKLPERFPAHQFGKD